MLDKKREAFETKNGNKKSEPFFVKHFLSMFTFFVRFLSGQVSVFVIAVMTKIRFETKIAKQFLLTACLRFV